MADKLKSVRLLDGRHLLGTIHDLDIDDMFWFWGRFVPEPAFETIRPFFAKEWQLLNSNDDFAQWEAAWERVVALGLTIDLGEGDSPLGPDEYLLHITDDNYARLRY